MLEVITPASSYNLCTLAECKTFLGISGTSQDSNIQSHIASASDAISEYLHRVVVSEVVEETFWTRLETMIVERFPIVSIASITERDTVLTAGTDFVAEVRVGMIYRLINGERRPWQGKTVIRYTGGFATVPTSIKEATFLAVKGFMETLDREAGIKSERLEGASEQSYFSQSGPWLLSEITQKLTAYRLARRL